MKAKGIDLSGLTKNQKNAMKRHSVHHTGNHLKAMVNAMKRVQHLNSHIKKL